MGFPGSNGNTSEVNHSDNTTFHSPEFGQIMIHKIKFNDLLISYKPRNKLGRQGQAAGGTYLFVRSRFEGSILRRFTNVISPLLKETFLNGC